MDGSASGSARPFLLAKAILQPIGYLQKGSNSSHFAGSAGGGGTFGFGCRCLRFGRLPVDSFQGTTGTVGSRSTMTPLCRKKSSPTSVG